MAWKHLQDVVDLQRACFPPPFPDEMLWTAEHLERHLTVFPGGQFVALNGDQVIASASSTIISEVNWSSHRSWDETVGGPFLHTFDPAGTTVYGLDISVHPNFRGKGVGRLLYQTRFDLVRRMRMERYGTACRLPGFLAHSAQFPGTSVDQYAKEVVSGLIADRTLTPLLRYGLSFITVIHQYMEDCESGDAAALLEWTP